jgi:hypothetical protein
MHALAPFSIFAFSIQLRLAALHQLAADFRFAQPNYEIVFEVIFETPLKIGSIFTEVGQGSVAGGLMQGDLWGEEEP